MHSSTWLPGALTLLSAVAVQACNDCEYAPVFPAAVCNPSGQNGVCQEQIKVIEIVVGDAGGRNCDVCAHRHKDDCSHCVTVVGPCPTSVNVAVTTTIINNGVTTVIIQTPTGAPTASATTLATATSAATSAATATPSASGVPFACDNNAFIMDGSNLYAVDPASGQTVSTIATNIAGDGAILSMGYNVLDNFIYALAPVSRSGASRVIRIDSQGGQTLLGDPIAIPYSLGDFDESGQLWVATADNTKWARIDLRPGSTTYAQVAESGSMTPMNTTLSDWAFVPSQGQFYGFTVSAMKTSQPVMWSPATKQFQFQTDLGQIAMTNGQPPVWGAAFTNGQRMFAVADGKSGDMWTFQPNARATIQRELGTTTVFTPNRNYGGARCPNAAQV
ncbi:hypothetical protein NLU13_2167 [Sarocladium strictum]|uniref:DUF6923 domain-containing protein n=1 Tax=Sarocladium strictum TaxID=5046 RepID=A0AA39LCZ4_SARSR|nr:hypothetical protein NLU13_2167 [Sarocladium strictum]